MGELTLVSNELMELFKGYNLTKNQSLILATLTENNRYLTVKEISQFSNLARETIYKVLSDLKEKGLVQKSITKPKKYCTIPLKNALQLFQEQQEKQIHELEMLKKHILLRSTHQSRISTVENQSQFILIPKKTQVKERIRQSISSSKEIVRIITSWKRHLKAIDVFEKAIEKALSNGVKFQVLVTEKSQEKNTVKARMFFNHPQTTVKFVNTSPQLVEVVINNTEAFLMSDPQSGLVESSALWSNHQSLVMALKTCFNTLWEK